MAIKWKNNKYKGILAVLLCVSLAGVIMCNLYPVFWQKAQKRIQTYQTEEEARVSKNRDVAAFTVGDDFERYLLSSIYYLNYEITPDMNAYTYLTQNYDKGKLTDSEQAGLKEAAARLMKNMRNQYVTVQDIYEYASYAKGVDKNFGSDARLLQAVYNDGVDMFDYYSSGLVISYDSRGVPDIRKTWNLDLDEIGGLSNLTECLTQATIGQLMDDNGMDEGEDYEVSYDETDEDTAINVESGTVVSGDETYLRVDQAGNDALLRQMSLPIIQNVTFVFGINGNYDSYNYMDDEYWVERVAYNNSGIATAGMVIIIAMALLALILQNIPSLELRKYRIFRLPTEVSFVIGCMGAVGTVWALGNEFAILTLKRGSDSLTGYLESDMALGQYAPAVAVFLIWLFWSCFAFGWYWLMASLLPYITHPLRTIWEQTLFFRFFVWLKRQWLRLWNWATDVELDEHLTRNIWKVVGINGLIVVLLCCIWFGGIFGAIIYSILLYVLIKKKCGEIQENYKKLLNVTQTIADGDLNASTEEDMGIFNPIRDQLTSIQSGFRKAVDEEVRSRNMKTELITNVSHDLKTPLTSIIGYIDLLKKEDMSPEAQDYVNVISQKSEHLKEMIQDLFEISKATSGNAELVLEKLDMVKLLQQTLGDMEDRISSSGRIIRTVLPEEPLYISGDGKRLYRVYQNLMENALKYSMEGTRIYVEGRVEEQKVITEIKNIAAYEMDFTADKIVERFQRGDVNRTTEGHGLGLAIAKSFSEACGGHLDIIIDGDMFKAVISYPLYWEN